VGRREQRCPTAAMFEASRMASAPNRRGGMEDIIDKTQTPLLRFALAPLGWILALVGIAGLFLPVLPGVLLIVAGALLVRPRRSWMNLAEKYRAQYPVLDRAFKQFSAWVETSKPHRERFGKFLIAFNTLKISGWRWRLSHGKTKMREELQHSADDTEIPYATRKVLVYDDDTGDLAEAAEPFEAHGFEVHKCTTIEAAMRSVEREEFDFALVDQGSPAFEGRRIIRHLVRYDPQACFVVVTRCQDVLCSQQALALGAMDYFEKPVSRLKMESIIKIILDAHRPNTYDSPASEDPEVAKCRSALEREEC